MELVIRLVPEDGARLFHQMYPDVMKSILEKDVGHLVLKFHALFIDHCAFITGIPHGDILADVHHNETDPP